MAESFFILELEFLHIRGGCSLIEVFFFLMFVGICCFILFYFLIINKQRHSCISVPEKYCSKVLHALREPMLSR